MVRRLAAVLLAALVPLGASPAPAVAASPQELQALLARRVAAFNSSAGIVVSDPLARATLYAHLPDELVVTASLYKLAVLLEAERRVEARQLSHTEEITIEPEDITDDGSFEPAGTILTLDEALERMITVSDNGTALALVRLFGATEINATLQRFGIKSFRLREREDQDNLATPRAVATFFERLARRELVSPAASDRMIARLARQQIRDRLPAQLPHGTVVAHKTGNLAYMTHDAGIIYGAGQRPIVVVVMTWDSDVTEAVELIQDVASLVYANAFAAPTSVGFGVPPRAVPADAGRGLFQAIRVTNLGRQAWSLADPDPFTLAWEMRDAKGKVVARNDSPIALGNIRAGGAIDLPLLFPVPAAPGDYAVTLGLANRALGPLAPLGVATGRFTIRAHLPFLAAVETQLPSILHREEASALVVTVKPLPALTAARELRLRWRALDPRNNRELARGEVPLGRVKPTEATRVFTYLIAPALRGTYVFELFPIDDRGAIAGSTIRKSILVSGARTYGDELPSDLPATRPRRIDPIPRPTVTLPPLPGPLGTPPPSPASR